MILLSGHSKQLKLGINFLCVPPMLTGKCLNKIFLQETGCSDVVSMKAFERFH